MWAQGGKKFSLHLIGHSCHLCSSPRDNFYLLLEVSEPDKPIRHQSQTIFQVLSTVYFADISRIFVAVRSDDIYHCGLFYRNQCQHV